MAGYGSIAKAAGSVGGGNSKDSAIKKRFAENRKKTNADITGQDEDEKKALKADKARRRAQRGARVGAVQAASSGGSVINRIAPFEASIAGVSSRVKGRRT